MNRQWALFPVAHNIWHVFFSDIVVDVMKFIRAESGRFSFSKFDTTYVILCAYLKLIMKMPYSVQLSLCETGTHQTKWTQRCVDLKTFE